MTERMETQPAVTVPMSCCYAGTGIRDGRPRDLTVCLRPPLVVTAGGAPMCRRHGAIWRWRFATTTTAELVDIASPEGQRRIARGNLGEMLPEAW